MPGEAAGSENIVAAQPSDLVTAHGREHTQECKPNTFPHLRCEQAHGQGGCVDHAQTLGLELRHEHVHERLVHHGAVRPGEHHVHLVCGWVGVDV